MNANPQIGDAAARLGELEPRCGRDEAFALFDDLPAVSADELTGRFRGRELATGHPLDGLLTASGWYGKRFDDPESVHPLLFTTPDGTLFSVDPRRLPLGIVGRIPAGAVSAGRKLLGALEPALRTSKPRARLRDVRYRGTRSAGMVYDHLPIIDNFRRVDETTLLGAMDLRGMPQPYFFILTRD